MIEVRPAQLRDVADIKRLTLASADLGIPANRDISNEAVRSSALEHLEGLDRLIYRRRQAAVLVAVDNAKEGAVVGFLILEFNQVEETTGESQSFIYNMAVEPDYYGKYVGHKLVWEAAKVSHQHGFRYMTSRVTASNERALLSAIKLGFEIERYQLTLACGPEGRVPMPGRPMSERGHAVSRLLRKRKPGTQRDCQNQPSGEQL
ncbi:GNAT family N-acetyltransferase [bacterium]|nr:GNAT family N-acetyltransferase [bacterium]